MLNLKTLPKGIDAKVQKLQQYIHAKVLEKFALDTALYECYGRCHRTQTKDGFIPEVFVSGKDYQEVFFNDKVAATSFFGLSSKIEFDGNNLAPVHLIYFVNLKTLKPSITHLADEEVRNDIQRMVQQNPYGFTLTSIEIGIDTVYREYPGSRKTLGLKYRDMAPYHCFRLNLEVMYSINNC